jgi:nicotinamidase-related amidase
MNSYPLRSRGFLFVSKRRCKALNAILSSLVGASVQGASRAARTPHNPRSSHMTIESVEPIDPSKTALLIMDYQNGIVPMVRNPEELLAGARQAIDLIRSHGGTIGYVRVGFADEGEIGGSMGKRVGGPAAALEHFHADHPNTQIHADVAPDEGDIVVRKTRIGPFGSTDLHEQLQARGIDTLVLAGISTSGVVLSTVRDAHDRDYRLIVLEDLCADRDPDVHEVLTGKVFPGQAEVIDSAELHRLLH